MIRRRPGATEDSGGQGSARRELQGGAAARRRWEAALIGVMFLGYVGRYFTTSHLDVAMIRFQESEKMDADTMSDMLAIGAIGEFVGAGGHRPCGARAGHLRPRSPPPLRECVFPPPESRGSWAQGSWDSESWPTRWADVWSTCTSGT